MSVLTQSFVRSWPVPVWIVRPPSANVKGPEEAPVVVSWSRSRGGTAFLARGRTQAPLGSVSIVAAGTTAIAAIALARAFAVNGAVARSTLPGLKEAHRAPILTAA